jgi:hypothetical protein
VGSSTGVSTSNSATVQSGASSSTATTTTR